MDAPAVILYIMNKRGDKTHPCVEPVKTTFTLEVVLFTLTYWGLPTNTSSANSDSSLNSEINVLNNR